MTGDASRYEKYFAFNVPACLETQQAEVSTSPCLPAEENDVDNSFWHLDQDFGDDDEDLRRRVDRFAEQLIDRMSDNVDLPDDNEYDDNDGSIVYHRTESTTDDENQEDSFEESEQEEEVLQETGARSGSPNRDNDAWLF